jgi:hypothetical protein
MGHCARLEVVRWRALALLVSFVVLTAMAGVLLGVKTDARTDEDLKESRLVETIVLLTDSTLPAVRSR